MAQNIGVKTSKLRNFQECSHSCIERAPQRRTMFAAKLLVALGFLVILMTEVEGIPAQNNPSEADDRSTLESPTLDTLPQPDERIFMFLRSKVKRRIKAQSKARGK